MKNVLDAIESLQQKPESARKAIAAGLVIVIMVFIIGVWLATFSLPSSGDNALAADNASADIGQPSPFTLLWNFAKDSAGSLKNLIYNK